ncbi:MAG: glycerol-3-phosphate acyltransferase [Acidimicrobiales bacterium]
MKIVAAALVGYAAGNLPSADLAARAAGGADLRTEGTHNPGAMNAAHVLGRTWGLAVSAADIAKGAAAARVGRRLAGPAGANAAATAAVVGHCFPVGRRGGKGVATSIGQVVGTFPSYLPVDMAVAGATSMLPFFAQRTRTATMVASATWVACATVAWRRHFRNPGGVAPTASLPLAALVSSLVIAVRFAAEAEKVAGFNAAATDRGVAA